MTQHIPQGVLQKKRSYKSQLKASGNESVVEQAHDYGLGLVTFKERSETAQYRDMAA